MLLTESLLLVDIESDDKVATWANYVASKLFLWKKLFWNFWGSYFCRKCDKSCPEIYVELTKCYIFK